MSTRVLGVPGATIIGLGAIVGGGVLALAGVAFGAAGPSAILAFVLNGVIALLTVLAYAELSSAFPENGGSYTFTKKVLSVQAAFGVGWIVLFASIAAGVLYALGFAAYAVEATGAIWRLVSGAPPDWLATRTTKVLVAGAAIAFYAVILTRTKGGTGRNETIGKLIVFAVIIVGGAWMLAREPSAAAPAKFTPFFAGGTTGLFAAMGFTFIALQGFDIIAAVAGEVRDPVRTLPRAMVLSVVIALVVYIPLLLLIVTVGVPEGQDVASLGRAKPETMIADAVGRFLGPAGFWLVMAAALLSMLSALFANLLAASRIVLAMAADRTLPRVFDHVSERTGVPVRGVLVSAVVMAVMLLAVPDVGSAGAAASLIFLVAFALTHIANLMARRRLGADFRGFRAPFYPVPQVLGLLCCIALAVFQSFAVPAAGSITAVWLLGGFVFYFTVLADRAGVRDAQSEATDPALVRLRGRRPVVLVPIAHPARAPSMVEAAQALAAPAVGRLVLLSIVRPVEAVGEEAAEDDLLRSQEVLREAIREAQRHGVRTEALVTIAEDRWDEILRVAERRGCETLLLGLGPLDDSEAVTPIERVVGSVDVDVVLMGSPPHWQLRDARRLLVPITGAGLHDQLRAQLLSGLCRTGERSITYLRVAAPDTSARDLRRIEKELRRASDDEVSQAAERVVVTSSDVLGVLEEYAARSDLVIVGTTRDGRYRTIGPTAARVARATRGGVILISHRPPTAPLSR